MHDNPTKACTKCHVVLPATTEYFGKHKLGRNGLHSSCKECERVRARAYRKAHPEKRRKSARKWEESNRERYLAIKKANYQRNRPARLEQERLRRAENPEYFKQKWQEWKERNPSASQVIVRNRRAKLKAAEGVHSVRDILTMLEGQNGLCAYCECELGTSYEVDHMTPVCKGGRNDWPNLAIACRACNRAKGTKTAEEFMNDRAAISARATTGTG